MNKLILNNNITIEDMCIYKRNLIEALNKKETIVLDFNKVKLPSTYYSSLLIEIIGMYGRENINKYIEFKNINNKLDFNRVFYGTSMIN